MFELAFLDHVFEKLAFYFERHLQVAHHPCDSFDDLFGLGLLEGVDVKACFLVLLVGDVKHDFEADLGLPLRILDNNFLHLVQTECSVFNNNPFVNLQGYEQAYKDEVELSVSDNYRVISILVVEIEGPKA